MRATVHVRSGCNRNRFGIHGTPHKIRCGHYIKRVCSAVREKRIDGWQNPARFAAHGPRKNPHEPTHTEGHESANHAAWKSYG
jgi:hypothetical protein